MLDSKAARVVATLIAVIGVIALFFVLGGDETGKDTDVPTSATPASPETPKKEKAPAQDSAPEVPVIEVKGGEPVGGVAELSFDKGDEIELVVASDTADELHLHGYDAYLDVDAGGKAKFSVPAEIEGVFELELHSTATPLAEITVNP